MELKAATFYGFQTSIGGLLRRQRVCSTALFSGDFERYGFQMWAVYETVHGGRGERCSLVEIRSVESTRKMEMLEVFHACVDWQRELLQTLDFYDSKRTRKSIGTTS